MVTSREGELEFSKTIVMTTQKCIPVLTVYNFKCVTNRQEEPTDRQEKQDNLTPDLCGLTSSFLLYSARIELNRGGYTEQKHMLPIWARIHLGPSSLRALTAVNTTLLRSNSSRVEKATFLLGHYSGLPFYRQTHLSPTRTTS